MKPALLILASYLIGAFPTSYLVGKLVRGIDLREHGSGNLGATNTFRVLGWTAAVPVFIVDTVKGLIPTAFFPRWDGAPEPTWAIGYGAAAIIGHVFSIYVGFKGGKGVATASGVFLALAPVAVGVGMAVWVAVLSITGYVSLASVLAAVVVPMVVLIVQGVGPVFGLALAIGVFVIFAHRANIKRLLRGEEHRFRRKTEPSA